MDNQSHHSQIAAKRERLFSADYFHKNFTLLAAKRAEFEKKIAHAITEIDRHHHQLSKHHTTPASEEILYDQKRELFNLKKEMQDLDLIWDEWDELTEHQIQQMRNELFNEIWQDSPNLFKHQQKEWEELEHASTALEQIDKVQNALFKLHETLLIALNDHKSTAQQQSTIQTSLAKVEKELEKALINPSQSPLQLLFQQIQDHLHQLKEQRKNLVAPEFESKMILFAKLLQDYRIENQTKVDDLKESLDNWLREL